MPETLEAITNLRAYFRDRRGIEARAQEAERSARALVYLAECERIEQRIAEADGRPGFPIADWRYALKTLTEYCAAEAKALDLHREVESVIEWLDQQERNRDT